MVDEICSVFRYKLSWINIVESLSKWKVEKMFSLNSPRSNIEVEKGFHFHEKHCQRGNTITYAMMHHRFQYH